MTLIFVSFLDNTQRNASLQDAFSIPPIHSARVITSVLELLLPTFIFFYLNYFSQGSGKLKELKVLIKGIWLFMTWRNPGKQLTCVCKSCAYLCVN